MVTNKDNSPLNNYAPDFELPGTDGEVHHLTPYLEKFRALAIVFMSKDCPYVKMYLDRLKKIQSDFNDRGFTIIAIDANDTDTPPENILDQMKSFAETHSLNFPYLRDSAQDVARCFCVEYTPQVFILDKEGKICYAGAIDDAPEAPEFVKNEYLRDSIEAILAGGEIKINQTESKGTPIEWRK